MNYGCIVEHIMQITSGERWRLYVFISLRLCVCLSAGNITENARADFNYIFKIGGT